MNQEMLAGFGRGTICFQQEMFPTEGFCAVHDEPHVRLMVLKTPQDAFALMVLELVICPPDMLRAWRERIGEAFALPAEKVWVHVNHTITTPHEPGPKGLPDKRPAPTEADLRRKALYREAVETAVEQAICSAREDLSAATLGWGAGECRINGNRDVETPYGWWVGPAGDGLSNHRFYILRLNRTDGSPKGLVLFYGIKPCAADNSGMQNDTRLVSSDVTGAACRALEERFGVPAMFCMTAAGDQVPVRQSLLDTVSETGEVFQRDEGAERGLVYAAKLGKELADSVEAVVRIVECSAPAGETRWAHVSFPWDKRRSGRRQLCRTLTHEWDGQAEVTAELFCLDDTAFVAVRPEVNAATEKELAENSSFARTILISMVNGDSKYMPEQSAFDRATWEAQSSMFMPGAAEKLTEAVCETLKNMR